MSECIPVKGERPKQSRPVQKGDLILLANRRPNCGGTNFLDRGSWKEQLKAGMIACVFKTNVGDLRTTEAANAQCAQSWDPRMISGRIRWDDLIDELNTKCSGVTLQKLRNDVSNAPTYFSIQEKFKAFCRDN